MSWNPIHTHSHYSLQRAITRPEALAKACADYGYGACALTDYGNLGAAVEFSGEMAKVGVKPILGCEFNISRGDPTLRTRANGRPYHHTTILARNLDGWKSLMSAVSLSASKEHSFQGPRMAVENFRDFARGGGLVAAMGYPGSDLANALFTDPKLAYGATTYEGMLKYFPNKCREVATPIIENYISVFGKENLVFAIEVVDGGGEGVHPATKLLAKIMRAAGEKFGIPCVASRNVHYLKAEVDPYDHRVMLCAKMKTTLEGADKKKYTEPDYTILEFFKGCDDYYLPLPGEMIDYHSAEEIANSVRLAEECETYSITQPPRLPTFPCPDGLQPEAYLQTLCDAGWRDKIAGRLLPQPIEVYEERLRMEMGVIAGAGLSSYFLIVQDFMQFCRRQNWIVGPGRGCLTADIPIVMVDGSTRSLESVQVGAEVIGRDNLPHRVLERFEYDVEYNEELLCIKTYYGDSCGVTLTKDHEILAEKRQRPEGYERWPESRKSSHKSLIEPSGTLEWTSACELEVGDWVFVPSGIDPAGDWITLDLSQYCDIIGTRFDDEYVYHEQHNPLTGQLVFSRRLSRMLHLDYRWLQMLGMFVGNGWLRRRTQSEFGIALHGHHREKIDFVVSLLTDFGIDHTVRWSQRGTLCQITIRNRVLSRMMAHLHDQYQCTARTKHVPEILFKMPREAILSYLRGYFITDGHKDEYKSVATSVSRRLADQIRTLCRLCSIPSSLRVESRTDTRPGWAGIRTNYYITTPHVLDICGQDSMIQYRYRQAPDGYITQIRQIDAVSGVRKVYDIRVADQSNYLTSSFLVHNSGAGCLISYLTGITGIDPVEYGLIFERFYNAGRNAPGKVSLPDIDSDIPKYARPIVYRYLQDTYGEDRVAQIATFSSMQGRSAVTEVMRAHSVNFDEIKRITKKMPDKARISEELEEMRQAGEVPSIISYCLDILKDDLREWVVEEEDGTLTGTYAKYFEQARRLEGTKTHIGRHAAGIVIGAEPLAGICPLKWDEGAKAQIAALDWQALEAVGLCKIDLLAVVLLDKAQGVRNLARYGRVEPHAA